MEKTPLVQAKPPPYDSIFLSPDPYLSPPPPPYYGGLQFSQLAPTPTTQLTQQQKPPHHDPSGGQIVSVPFVSLVVILVIVFVMIFGVTLVTNDQKQQFRHTFLKQSAPALPNNGDISIFTSTVTPPLSTDHLDVDTPQGRLRGYTKISRQGRNYTAFFKVPYAEPPINSLRFKDPQPPRVPTWTGLRDIPIVAPQCIQKEKYSDVIQAVGEEDCLYANIYIPNIASSSGLTSLQDLSLPVMVYIHGGGFTDGNGSRYGADYFMDEDVIIVTFQYRLGPFGFLNTQDNVIHGNMGFKDQVQMLIWVRDNIKYFGGDSSQVTIFGNSAGGMSISLLMLSPMAKGLFHRAITQSGANICATVDPKTFVADPIPTVREVGRVLNCESDNSSAFLECLLNKDAKDIALVRSFPTVYAVSVEHRNDAQVFMPDTPYNVLKSQPNVVPYIIGVVNSEWAGGNGLDILNNPELVEQLNNDFGANAKTVLDVDMNEEELLSVKEFYFGNGDIGNDTFREVFDMVSDRGLIHCSYVSAHMHAKYSPAYLYYISKPPAKSYMEKSQPGYPAKELGILSHADELQYFFLYDGYPEIPVGDPEYFQFSANLVKLWATFAATGSPDANNIEWKPVDSTLSSNSTFWLELNDNPGRTEVIRDRMNFWDQFTYKQLKYEL